MGLSHLGGGAAVSDHLGCLNWLIVIDDLILADRLACERLGSLRAIDVAVASWVRGLTHVRPTVVAPLGLCGETSTRIEHAIGAAGLGLKRMEPPVIASALSMVNEDGGEVAAISSASDILASGRIVGRLAEERPELLEAKVDLAFFRDVILGLAPALVRTSLGQEYAKFGIRSVDSLIGRIWEDRSSHTICALSFASKALRDVHVIQGEARIGLATDRATREMAAVCNGLQLDLCLNGEKVALLIENHRRESFRRTFALGTKRQEDIRPRTRRRTVQCFSIRSTSRTGGDAGIEVILNQASANRRYRYGMSFPDRDGELARRSTRAGLVVSVFRPWMIGNRPSAIHDMVDDVIHAAEAICEEGDTYPDLIFANTTSVGAISAAVALHIGVPYVCRVVEVLPRSVLQESMICYANKVIVPSRYMLSRCENIGVPHTKLRVVPESVSEEWLSQGTREGWLRRELGLDASTQIVGVLGRVDDRDKRCDLAVMVAASVIEQQPNVVFVFCGDVNPESHISALARQVGISNSVRFLGFRRDLPRVVVECDVILHTAAVETFGLVLAQSMAVGVPVVAVSVGGIPDHVIDGETGYLVESSDPSKIVAPLLTLLGSAALREKFGEQGRNRVRSLHSPAMYVDRLEDIFDEVLGGGL